MVVLAQIYRRGADIVSQYYSYTDFHISLMPAPTGMLFFLNQEVNSWQGLQILDVACGSGLLAQEMAESGANVTAMDCDRTVLSQAMELARTHRRGRVPYFIQGSLADLPGEAESYQMILCLSNAVSSLPDADAFQEFFQKVALLLVRNGRFVLQLFNYDRILRYKDYTLEGISMPEDGISIQRHFEPVADGYLDLVSRIRILRSDAFEISSHRSRVWPVTSDFLRTGLQDAGFGKVNFYADVSAVSWQPDSYSTLIVAVRS